MSRRAEAGWLLLALPGACVAAFAALVIDDTSTALAAPHWSRARTSLALAAIDAGDGIDGREARALAHAYWVSHRDILCGGADDPERAGDFWDVHIGVGIAGDEDGGSVLIHARTGGIRSTFARAYRDVDELRAYLEAYAVPEPRP